MHAADTATDTLRREAPDDLYRRPHWFACYTRARSEKKTGVLLGRLGIETYIPLLTEVRQWADRKKTVSVPLFPSYVFARFDLKRLHEVLTVPLVATVARPNGYPTPLRESELAGVRRLLEGVNLTGHAPEPVDVLELGDEVVVIDGPFKGLEGQLVEVRGRTRVAVRITALRQARAVRIDRKMLKPLETRSSLEVCE